MSCYGPDGDWEQGEIFADDAYGTSSGADANPVSCTDAEDAAGVAYFAAFGVGVGANSFMVVPVLPTPEGEL